MGPGFNSNRVRTGGCSDAAAALDDDDDEEEEEPFDEATAEPPGIVVLRAFERRMCLLPEAKIESLLKPIESINCVARIYDH